MRLVRALMAVMSVLMLAAPAQAQYGLYGAPSTLPLQPPQPTVQSVPSQYPPLYVDTSEPRNPLADPTAAYPVYANQAYAYPSYAARVSADPGYMAPVYSGQWQAGTAVPRVLPETSRVPYDPAYTTPVVPTSAYQPGAVPQVPQPIPAPGVPQPGLPGPITQMLNNAPNDGQLGGCAPPADYGADCGGCSPVSCAPYCPTWFGSVAALYMGRNEPNRLWTTFETDNNPNQLPTDALPDWAVGGEVTIGRFFGCNTCDPCDPCGNSGRMFGVEASYWGLDSMDGYSSQAIAGGSVSTPLLVDEIEFGGVNGTVYFDSAAQHIVRRKDEFHNLEVNFLASPGGSYQTSGCGLCNGRGCSRCCGYGTGPFSVGWALGVRYFRFEENYLFGSVDTGRTWGEAGGIYEAYLEDNVRNQLIGAQFGCDLSYRWLPNWRLFAAPKLGIYNNHVEHYFGLTRGDGVVANPTAASGVTGTYPVRSEEDALSFLSEIDLGLDWQVAPNWSMYLGYRVIFATGIALADNQIPTYVVDIPEIADIDTNGDLIVHGAFAGVTLRF